MRILKLVSAIIGACLGAAIGALIGLALVRSTITVPGLNPWLIGPPLTALLVGGFAGGLVMGSIGWAAAWTFDVATRQQIRGNMPNNNFGER